MLAVSFGLARRMALFLPLSSACVIFELPIIRVCARWQGAQAAGEGCGWSADATAPIEPARARASFKAVSAPHAGTSFDVDSLLLFRLRLRVQLQHDGPFAISILLALETVVYGGESYVGFGKGWGFLHDRFQLTA